MDNIYIYIHIAYGLATILLLSNYNSSMVLGHVHVDIRSYGDGDICVWK